MTRKLQYIKLMNVKVFMKTFDLQKKVDFILNELIQLTELVD